MENPNEGNDISQMVSQMQEMNQAQLRVMKKQLNLVRFMALFLTVAMSLLLFYVITSFTRMSTAMEDIQAVSAELAEADWPEMINNVNTLVTTSQASVELATTKLESIDFEALNQSIRDLNSIIAPLASFFK